MYANRIQTIKKLSEALWQFEKENDVFNIEIRGIKIWEIVRFNIFNDLSLKLGLYEHAHTFKKDLGKKIKKLPSRVYYSILKNPFLGEYTRDILIYDHARKMKVDGAYIDIYTHDFINKQKENKISFDVIESPYNDEHITSVVEPNRKFRDHEMLIMKLSKRIHKLKLNLDEVETIKKLDSRICEFFYVKNINTYKLIIAQIEKFEYRYNYHKKLLAKRKPKYIYVVVSYNCFAIIAAAKDLGIKVIEFQHGVITPYHFAYNFSDPTVCLKYFPDKLLTFGEYWARTDGFPKQTEIEVMGFPYLNQQIEKYKDMSKKNNQILFISQGTIGKDLSKMAKEIAEKMTDYQFVYKLHPGEYARWKTEYNELVSASNLSNFEVIDNNEKNLYALFAESEYQFGVYSTAIFEGLTLNCKTILVELPGIEYMQDLIDENIVELANDVEDAIYILTKNNSNKFPKGYFFKDNINDEF